MPSALKKHIKLLQHSEIKINIPTLARIKMYEISYCLTQLRAGLF